MTRVLLADNIVRAAIMAESLSGADAGLDVCGVARTPDGLFSEARALRPDIVVVREKFAGVDGFALAEEISMMSPLTRVVVISDEDTPEGRTRAQRAGVTEYVTGEIDSDTLVAAIHAATRTPVAMPAASPAGQGTPAGWGIVMRDEAPATPGWEARTTAADVDEDGHGGPSPDQRAPHPMVPAELDGGSTGIPVQTSPPDAPPSPQADPMQPVVQRRPLRRGGRKTGEVFIVFAGKGGVGKSTVATNLSCALAADGARVAIVDLDLQFGDVGVMLGVEHPHTIEELAQVGEAVDMDYLEDIMGTGPGGVRVLLAPSSPELADLVTTALLRAIIRELAKNFDYVIIDAAAHLEERTLEMLEMADHILVVTAFNVTSVKDTKIMLKLLSSLGIDKERIAVILNQTRQRTNFTKEEVEDSLRFRVVAQLPFEPRVVDEAIDHGRPFILNEPKAEITRQFRMLVDYLAPHDDAHAEPNGDPKAHAAGGRTGRRRFSLGRS